MSDIEKIKNWTYWSFRALLITSFLISIYTKNYFNLIISLITLVLTFLPSMIEKKYKIDYPGEFEIFILIFLFASMFLGEIYTFYHRFWWWDLMLHTISGLTLALIAFSLIYMLNSEEKLRINLSPGFMVLFAFCFAVALGAIWEIFEYAMDNFFNLNMQKSGLVDTMEDLIVDSIGALIVSIMGLFYFRGRLRFLKKISDKFKAHNPRFFK
jgi:hypothetical protein